MTMLIVAGLFQSRGIAEDACNRLHTEGVPREKMAIKTLKETGPVPAMVHSELAALWIDPLVLGDVRQTFVDYIRNGETLVLVGADSPSASGFARQTLEQYAPMAIEVFVHEERPAMLRDL
jgi:hypothetical protein